MTRPGPAYKIVTSRLLLRAAGPMDTAILYDAIQQSRDHLLLWMRWAKFEPVTVQERLEYLRTTRGNFDLDLNYGYLIFDLTGRTFLGAAGLHVKEEYQSHGIGYWMHKDHVNQGFATEAAAVLTRLAFEVHHSQWIYIYCDPQNIYSLSIPKKLGYAHEATLRHRIEDATDALKDMMVWTLFNDQYPGSPASKQEMQAFDAVGRQIL